MKIKGMIICVCAIALSLLSTMVASAQTKKVNVAFKPGTSSGTYSNTLTGYGTVDFYVKAKGGQTMSIKLSSTNTFLYFNVANGTGDGEAIADNAREVTEWSGQLPADGTYVIRVYLVRAEARRNKRPVSFKVQLEIN
ncbi:MAG TPA: hypothetical protein VLB68_03125 [Pyrinomonadaceae bacterium]|nr:hypothetical protein [Pyrinomonadaceae bacterium]